MLCRIGFPFAEFTNYTYDEKQSEIHWTNTGKQVFPFFPIEGMLTRSLIHVDGSILGFELSTPGLRGQSGGPVFDKDGMIWGVQSKTAHLDLNFDINQKLIRQGKITTVKDSAFLHVGHCVHVGVVKKFLTENKVSFTEG